MVTWFQARDEHGASGAVLATGDPTQHAATVRSAGEGSEDAPTGPKRKRGQRHPQKYIYLSAWCRQPVGNAWKFHELQHAGDDGARVAWLKL